MVDLTPRQLTFLNKLLELYRENRGPVHYTQVARRVGVNKFSAYDMLKVLERKGFVSSDYIFGKHSGPGRSRVVFYPTARAMVLSSPRLKERSEEWRQFSDQLLQRLREAREADYGELFGEFLAKLSDNETPLVYCAKAITTFLLSLYALKDRVKGVNPFEALREITSTGEVGLGALAGLSLGSSLAERADHPVVGKLYTHIKRFQKAFQSLSEEGKKLLSDFLQEAINAVAS